MIVSIFGRELTTIRIPLSGSVPIPGIIKKLIETPEWQRLLNVKQLGLALNVYPGAVHTRAEHCLGTFALLDRYLERLHTQEEFQKTFSKTKLSALLIAGLFHDVGQPPLSHWADGLMLEDGTVLPSHESKVKEVMLSGESGRLIERELGISPDAVFSLIEGKEPLAQLLSGEMDADRVDFLQRDAYHTGVPYGVSFDVERFVSSLFWESSSSRLALTKKGIHPLLSFMAAYDIMYEAVYVHKTVNALSSMLKKAIRIAHREGLISRGELLQVLNATDSEFEAFLQRKTEKSPEIIKRLLNPLFLKKREIVKLVAEINLGENKLSQKQTLSLEKQLEKETGATVIVEMFLKPLPSPEKILIADTKRGKKPALAAASEFLRFSPFSPISVLRIYTFEEAKEKVLGAVKDYNLHKFYAKSKPFLFESERKIHKFVDTAKGGD